MVEKQRAMKQFSETEEDLIAHYLFTNPSGDTGFIYPQELVAGEELSPLMSAYSRTHVPFTRRVLQFLDTEKAGETRGMLPYMASIMNIFREADGTLKISRKTGNFNREWVLAHGHSSIKEMTPLFGWVENVSDITGKRITGHPLCKPQVKSTRYLSYKSALDLALGDEDLLGLAHGEEAIAYIRSMNERYLAVTEQLTDAVFGTRETKAIVAYLQSDAQVVLAVEKALQRKMRIDPEFVADDTFLQEQRGAHLKSLQDPEVRKDIGKFVLDSSRSYLTAANRTSLGFAADARVLEEIITDMISSPRLEDQKRGYALWTEAKKIAPVLLGEKSHIAVDPWRQRTEELLRDVVKETWSLGNKYKLAHLVDPKLFDTQSDRFQATLALFPYSDKSLGAIYAALIDDPNVVHVLEKAHEGRGTHDVVHPAIAHGGLMFELAMPYHAYRDMFRHRRGSRSVQLLTTRLGFETPEIFSSFGLAEDYQRDMQRAEEMYERTREISPHVAEKVVPFGANCRALHSWSPTQVGYIGRLRGNHVTGNRSYVQMTRQMLSEVAQVMPQTAAYFKVEGEEYPAELWKRGYDWHDETQRGKD